MTIMSNIPNKCYRTIQRPRSTATISKS